MADQANATVSNVDPTRVASYRDLLQITAQKSQEDYDKTVIALSGGALGLSFSFVTDFVAPGSAVASGLLIGAWGAWVVSLLAVLGSFYCAIRGNVAAIRCVDQGKAIQVGRGWDGATTLLNIVGGIAFILGAFLIVSFISRNIHEMEAKPMSHDRGPRSPVPGKVEKGHNIPMPPPVSTPGRPGPYEPPAPPMPGQNIPPPPPPPLSPQK